MALRSVFMFLWNYNSLKYNLFRARKCYLIVLSDVNSTTWGSRISLGYQEACFRVRDDELVKNLSAIGMVLENTCLHFSHKGSTIHLSVAML